MLVATAATLGVVAGVTLGPPWPKHLDSKASSLRKFLEGLEAWEVLFPIAADVRLQDVCVPSCQDITGLANRVTTAAASRTALCFRALFAR